MRILVVGGGGREHALCWAIAASPICENLYCAPGNPGIAQEAECIDIAAHDVAALTDFARSNTIDFVVVGPEQPLVDGLVDRLTEHGIKSFGPTAAAARLEGSKGFMKDLCHEYNIPTATYRRFDDADTARDWAANQSFPLVVKADGLAAGKGVTIVQTPTEAIAAINAAMTDRAFGAAGGELVIEEFLTGEEMSFFALVDGETALPFGAAHDYKPVGDGNVGPNTGGMGAYTPSPSLTDTLQEQIMEEIIEPTLRGMSARGTPFRGVLYAGLMLTPEGPKLLEYNVRFGDPECQVLLMRLKSDLLPALIAAHDGMLKNFNVRWYDEAALTVVMATEGYPGAYQKGSEIRGLKALDAAKDVVVFHAGTKADGDSIRANGGRVLNITALGETKEEARERAYQAITKIDWPEGFCRSDIGVAVTNT